MTEKANTTTKEIELRSRAEALLKKKKKKKKKKTAPAQTEAETQRFLHELEVHQIELEMQNEELQDARAEVEAGLVKYTDLYDFAPVGYFSIDERGLIQGVNLTGATLLGIERARLIKRRLPLFVAPTSRPIFLAFLERVFTEPGKQVCEAELIKADGVSFWADFHAHSAVSLGGSKKGCHLAVSDITPLKRAEEAQRRMKVLAAANRELTQEIKRRKVVEDDLKKSEQQSSRLLTKSLKLQGQLRHLSHQVLRVQEDERKRISRELHDEILQILTGVNVHLASMKMTEATGNCKDCKRKISATQRLVEKSVDTVHRFARELRPTLLDDLGLIPALRSYMKDVMKRTDLRIGFTSFHDRVEELDNDQRTVLYRVAQEAITNVVRHAQASEIEVRLLKCQDVIGLEIKDNGKSFRAQRVLSAVKHKRLGLLCMRERVEMVGGTFTIESEPDQGTLIRAEIPVTNVVEED